VPARRVPELVLTGYPPEDLVLEPDLWRATSARWKRSLPPRNAARPWSALSKRMGTCTTRRGLCLGRGVGIVHKQVLPNYGVFDERRYFTL